MNDDDEVLDESDTETNSSDQNDFSEGSNINIKKVKLSVTAPKQSISDIITTSTNKRKRGRPQKNR